MTLHEAIQQRILLFDGAMGTLIQSYNLTEEDFRVNLPIHPLLPLKGNNDLLSITRPDVVSEIHRRYLEAGADIIFTNTFSAQRISQHEYKCEDLVIMMNRQAVRLARAEADRMTALTPEQPRFVLGDIGPTSKMLSMSEDVNNPASRAVSFNEIEQAYFEQLCILIEEGVDGIIAETAFDTLNIKALISAYILACEKLGKTLTASHQDIPLLLSITISDRSGRILSGQTVEAFMESVRYAHPFSVGLNCGMGADDIKPYLTKLRSVADCYVSCHPNAGLPDELGIYSETPAMMAEKIGGIINEGLADIVGACCGSTPEHIREIRKVIDAAPRKECSDKKIQVLALHLSGLEAFSFDRHSDFIVVGERCNVAGSRKFLRLINEKHYDEALDIARTQIDKGGMVIDVNMDDGLLDARKEMCTFLNLIASEPSISRIPLMIDSSSFDVIEAGLKCCQGKCIVNSISLKQGEEEFLRQARIVKHLGAAVIVMCFDEDGQATNYERRVDICKRAYSLLVDKVGFCPSDIIFDPNILTVATGMKEHDNYARDFLMACEWITNNLPETRISGGLSNLSFAFRGNNYIREAMHSVFLHLAKQRGMTMAIMNPATRMPYEDIPKDLRDTITAVLLNTDEHASERLSEMAEQIASSKAKTDKKEVNVGTQLVTPEERLREALIQGVATNVDADLHALISAGRTPLEIISGPLMEGMNEVGKRFGEGEMFLPQVVKTARTMKRAVEVLQPYMTSDDSHAKVSIGTIVIATVKGDVHDIGKNIVSVVLSCNGFHVIDLGVMVPAEKIVEVAIKEKADFVCLSGLITPSLNEMGVVASLMQKQGLTIPLIVGGATTSDVHTAVKLAPLYDGGVFHVNDAAQNPVLATRLLNPDIRETIIKENKDNQQQMRETFQRRQGLSENDYDMALGRRFTCDWNAYKPVLPPSVKDIHQYSIAISKLVPLIDWNYFFWAWRVKEDSEEGRKLKADAMQRLSRYGESDVICQTAFYPAVGSENSIIVRKDDETKIVIPTPRQSLNGKNGQERDACLSLCDFISPLANDYVGVMAATVHPSLVADLEQLKEKDATDYDAILLQTLFDRLVEAASVYMEKKLKADGWGGIRPAVGYPSLPDQDTIFILQQLLNLPQLGITLTENGAMYPQASILALMISHPEACYFEI